MSLQCAHNFLKQVDLQCSGFCFVDLQLAFDGLK